MRARPPGVAGLFLVLALLVAALPAVAVTPGGDGVVVIETGTGEHTFTIELAADPASRARGLMYRQSLAADHGMLFDFGVDREVGMWMKDTYISLDMVFILADGTVHRIARSTTPFSTETVQSRGPVRAVLEINAGRADQIGLKRGDSVRHAMFGNAD